MPFIVDCKMDKIIVEELKKIDGNIFFSFDCRHIYRPVATHPDLQIHFVSEKTAYVPPELFYYYRNILPDYVEIKKGNKSLGGSYPDNVAYNIARMNDFVVANEKYADELIISYYKKIGMEVINVRQGYTKCNICTDGEKVLTEDAGIYNALQKHKKEVMLIPSGEVCLDGFPYGFIGGASVCFGNRMVFCGQCREEYKEQIENFFCGSDILYLGKEKMRDYGSIIYFE